MSETMASLGNVGLLKFKTIATAAANQTFGAQLTYLKPYFTSLTDDEKALSMIQLNYTANTNLCTNNQAGIFARVVSYNDIRQFSFDTLKYTESGTDKTSNTNQYTLSLIVLSAE